jgi:hypothetical protein
MARRVGDVGGAVVNLPEMVILVKMYVRHR